MMNDARYTDIWYKSRLQEPISGRHRVVIDTDAANEIDDPYAIAWALARPDVLEVVGLHAEPFSFAHRRADHRQAPPDCAAFNPPDVGMERSHDEIHRVIGLMGEDCVAQHRGLVRRGATRYQAAPGQAVPSAAADHLVELARAQPADGPPLYVLALGCVTNIASALIQAPDIRDRIVVVWTSGYPSHAPLVNHSFNLEQDLFASQHLFDCGVPLVYLPGYHVGAQLRLSLLEMEHHVRGHSAIGDHLHDLFTHNPLWPMLGWPATIDRERPYSWVIWDIICVAWLIQPAWVPSHIVQTPRLSDDRRWLVDAGRPPMREAYGVQRDEVFGDLFEALRKAP